MPRFSRRLDLGRLRSAVPDRWIGRFAALLGGLALLGCGAASATEEFERIRIEAAPVPLDAIVYRPATPGPHPAVVALHGCGGLFQKSGQTSARHSDWGKRLAAQGFFVVMPDSYGSRGLGSQCTNASRNVRAGQERVADVAAVRVWLQQRADIRPEAISLLGWSNGGTAVLAAVRRDRRANDGRPDFARSVAFYPGCRVQAESRSFEARLPLLILIGAADDWTAPEPCQALVLAAKDRGEPVEIKLYPGAYHDFDHPRLELRQRQGLAFSAAGSGQAMAGTDPDARADALQRVPMFLAR